MYHWSNNKSDLFLSNEDEKKTIEKIIVNPYNEHHLGIGGVNNDIKIYDMNTKKPIFQGKAVRIQLPKNVTNFDQNHNFRIDTMN